MIKLLKIGAFGVMNSQLMDYGIHTENSDYRVHGGHLFEGIVSVTAEISVIPITPPIIRVKDERTGSSLLLDNNSEDEKRF